tara:strand:+ start:617 stop:886 length:270 start_codon:yes stop_codon:yes gene_type:complete
MYQAIITRKLNATTHRGTSITAYSQAGKITIPYDYAKSTAENHDHAAATLAIKYEWQGEWRHGALPDGTGYAYVREDSYSPVFTISEEA